MADTWRVLVTGSRTWNRPEVVYEALNGIVATVTLPLVVVHGKCDPWHPGTRRRIPWEAALRWDSADQCQLLGADWHASMWARDWAATNGPVVSEEAHPADWTPGGKFDRSAGYRRNAEMVALGASEALAFLDDCAKPGCREPQPHSSHGGDHCATMAAQAGVDVRRFKS